MASTLRSLGGGLRGGPELAPKGGVVIVVFNGCLGVWQLVA